MFDTSPITSIDLPIVTVSWKNRLAAINALDVEGGGLGQVEIQSGDVTCELHDETDPAFPDADPSERLAGGAIVSSQRISQFFTNGVEGADYVLWFTATLTNGEILRKPVRVPVRKYT